LARDHVARKRVPASGFVRDCGFVRADEQGGKLRGIRSWCRAIVPIEGRDSPAQVSVEFQRVANHWLIDKMTPELQTLGTAYVR
jgi:hypothetical protein